MSISYCYRKFQEERENTSFGEKKLHSKSKKEPKNTKISSSYHHFLSTTQCSDLENDVIRLKKEVKELKNKIKREEKEIESCNSLNNTFEPEYCRTMSRNSILLVTDEQSYIKNEEISKLRSKSSLLETYIKTVRSDLSEDGINEMNKQIDYQKEMLEDDKKDFLADKIQLNAIKERIEEVRANLEQYELEKRDKKINDMKTQINKEVNKYRDLKKVYIELRDDSNANSLDEDLMLSELSKTLKEKENVLTMRKNEYKSIIQKQYN